MWAENLLPIEDLRQVTVHAGAGPCTDEAGSPV
jgi:hypothetical protein